VKTTFDPTPDGTRWQAFLEREVTTVWVTTVDHDALNVPHDPDSLKALQAAIETRALELLAAGQATVVGESRPPIALAGWEQIGLGRDREALEYQTGRFQDEDNSPDGIVTVDLGTDHRARDTVAALDDDAYDRLAEAVTAVRGMRHRAAALHHIRGILAEDTPGQTAIGVLFSTGNARVGAEGTVLFTDGTIDDFDFGDDVQEALSTLYGGQGETFTVAVDLRDDSFNESNVHLANVYKRLNAEHLIPNPNTESPAPGKPST